MPLTIKRTNITSTTTPSGMTFRNRSNSGTSTAKSVLFNGSNQCLSVANNSAFDFGAGDFTIEGWTYSASSKEYGILVGRWGGYAVNGNSSYAIRQGAAASQKYQFGFTTNGSTDILINALNTFSLNTWYHLAAVRNGTTFTFYVNGVSQGTATNASAVFAGTTNLTVGGANNNTDLINGYASNVRLVKGTALYTSNFTPPTAPLTAIANTQLLTCQSATIVDNSTNNFAITNNNAATVSSTVVPSLTSAVTTPSGMTFRKVYPDPVIPYMVATGGDLVTTSGSYKIHKFTTVGTSSFTISNLGNSPSIEYLVVGGGGGGGGITLGGTGGGGGGQVTYNTGSIISAGIHSIIVGDGGVGGPIDNYGGNGQPSYVSIYATAIGGGGGAPKNANGAAGANGGGGGEAGGGGVSTVGGFSGAPGGNNSSYNGGGGGGAGANGSGRNGGNGVVNNILGTPMYYGGGGAGGEFSGFSTGGLGGGANNSNTGSANTGGGGSGTQRGGVPLAGYKGGSGIVIIKYRYTD